MASRKCGWMVAGALAASVAISATAGTDAANGQTQQEVASYSFAMTPVAVPEFAPLQLNNGYHGPEYAGSQTVQVNQFDTQGVFSLDQVHLAIDMNIVGTIQTYTYTYAAASTFQALQTPSAEDVTIELAGRAEIVGSVISTIPFNDVVDTPDLYGRIYLNESASSDDTPALDLSPFIGQGLVDIDVSAWTALVYQQYLDGSIADTLIASGDVTLTYTYSRLTGGVVPTPAAAGMGLALLVGAMVRRRR